MDLSDETFQEASTLYRRGKLDGCAAVYFRIIAAYRSGKGVRLSTHDVDAVMSDETVCQTVISEVENLSDLEEEDQHPPSRINGKSARVRKI